MGLERSRWETIYNLARGEAWYAQHEAKRLWARLPEDYRNLVAYEIHQCNYVRAYDLLRHEWPGEAK